MVLLCGANLPGAIPSVPRALLSPALTCSHAIAARAAAWRANTITAGCAARSFQRGDCGRSSMHTRQVAPPLRVSTVVAPPSTPRFRAGSSCTTRTCSASSSTRKRCACGHGTSVRDTSGHGTSSTSGACAATRSVVVRRRRKLAHCMALRGLALRGCVRCCSECRLREWREERMAEAAAFRTRLLQREAVKLWMRGARCLDQRRKADAYNTHVRPPPKSRARCFACRCGLTCCLPRHRSRGHRWRSNACPSSLPCGDGAGQGDSPRVAAPPPDAILSSLHPRL